MANREEILDIIKEEIVLNSFLNSYKEKIENIEENLKILNSSNNDIEFNINEYIKFLDVIEESNLSFSELENIKDSFIKNLSEELDVNFNTFNLDLASVAENISEDFNLVKSHSSIKRLEESYNNENGEEIEKSIILYKDKMTSNIEIYIDEVKFFLEKYDNNKLNSFLTAEEEEKKCKLKDKILNAMSSLTMSSSYFKNKNIDYLNNKENKEEIVKNYYQTITAVFAISIAMVIFRILFTKISVDYSITTTLDYVDDFKNFRDYNNGELMDKLSPKTIFSSIEMNDANIMNLVNLYSDPTNDNNKLLKYLLDVNIVNGFKSVSDLFAKRMSISYKYLHHIDNINKEISNLLNQSIGLTRNMTNKPADEIFNNANFDSIRTSILNIKNSIYYLKSDLKSYTLGSKELIKNK